MSEVGKTIALIRALGTPTDAQVTSAVEGWLDDHPEATTTVTDGSITNAKLASSFVTPGTAAAYSSSATYAVGDYVFYNGALYRCISAITTAEAWTAAHWTAAVLGDDVGDLKNAIDDIDEEITQIDTCIDTADTGNYETTPSSAVRFKHLYNFEKGKKYTITMTFTGATFQNVKDAVRVNQSPNSGDGVVGLLEEVMHFDAWEITGNTYTKEFTAAEGCINLLARYKFASGSQSVGFVVTESKGLKTVVNELDASIDTRFEYARQTSRMEMGAHRGAEFYAPPNSVAAYEIAGQMGFPWAWLAQIRWSAENTLYVMHDEDVSITTNGTGNMSELTDEYIDSLLCNKIQAYDYSKFSNDDLRVPTLEKAIQICLRYGMKMCFRIEPFPNTMETEDEIAIWTNFQTVVKSYGISADWAIYSGYNPNEMKLCRTLLGEDVELCPYLGIDISAQDYIDWFTENGISGNRSVLMPASAVTLTEAKLLHSNGIKLYAFTNSTVPTQATVEQLATWGVDILQNPKFARITDTN